MPNLSTQYILLFLFKIINHISFTITIQYSFFSHSFFFNRHNIYITLSTQLPYAIRYSSFILKRTYCSEIFFIHLLLCLLFLMIRRRISIFSVPLILVSIVRTVLSRVTHRTHSKNQFFAMRSHQIFIWVQMGR